MGIPFTELVFCILSLNNRKLFVGLVRFNCIAMFFV